MSACGAFSWVASLPSSPCSLTDCTVKRSCCDTVRQKARKHRKKTAHKQPRREDKTNPPTEVEISELIYFNFQLTLRFSNLLTLKSTSHLGWSTRSQFFLFFKQDLHLQLHKETEERASEACPFQNRGFVSTVTKFREWELFPSSSVCVVVLKSIEANFLVVRAVREKRDITGLFTSLLPFLPLDFNIRDLSWWRPTMILKCPSTFLPLFNLSFQVQGRPKIYCQCVLNFLFFHLRTTLAACHASNPTEPPQYSRNPTVGKWN